MTDVRPEVIDRYSLHHRHGCPGGPVVSRPAVVRPGWVYVRCERCHSIGMSPPPDDDGRAQGERER